MATAADRLPQWQYPLTRTIAPKSARGLAARHELRPRPNRWEPAIPFGVCLHLLTQLLGSVADPTTVAAEALSAFSSVVPIYAASITAWNPIEERHHTIATSYSLDDAAQRSDLPCQPRRWLDGMSGAQERESCTADGLYDALTVRLETSDGRYTGDLHFRPRMPYCPHAADHALVAMRTLLASITDCLRTPSAIARSLAPDALAAIVTGRGQVIELPGLPCGTHLVPDSPLVHTVATIVDDPAGALRLVWVDEVGGFHRVRIERLSQGAIVFEQDVPAPHQLTYRELDILTLLAGGHSNREIASLLVISLRTVATHVEHVLEKLGCASRTAAAARAVEEGLLRHPLPLPGKPSAHTTRPDRVI